MALPPGSNGERRFQRRSGKVWEEGQVHVRARDLWNMVLRGQGVTRLSPVPQVLSAACLGRVHHLRMGLLISVVEKGFPGGARGKESSSQRLRHGFDPWVRKIPWRRRWQPTPVFLPGKSHGSWSRVGYRPRGRKELDTTERLHFHFIQIYRAHTSLLAMRSYLEGKKFKLFKNEKT